MIDFRRARLDSSMFGRRRARIAGIRAARRKIAGGLTLALALATLVVVATVSSDPAGADPTSEAQTAVANASAQGYRSSIAILDTQTGTFWGAGDYESTYASESVVKVFIATHILIDGQMSGAVATTAYKMITQSDDESADELYGLAGGDSVINWVKSYFDIPDLGSPPSEPGWWGDTHITAHGMVEFYNDVEHNATVWPWLQNAMHNATEYGSDGTYQYFGIPSATTGFGIKQGWGQDDNDTTASADFNTTGTVDGDRYAIAILTKGPASDYGVDIQDMLDSEAQTILPGGVVDDPSLHVPKGSVDSIRSSGSTVVVSGWSFDPDATSESISVAAYEDGNGIAWFPTSTARPDVDAAYGITGTHGFDIVVSGVSVGVHQFCIYGINVGDGNGNPLLGCRSVAVFAPSPASPPAGAQAGAYEAVAPFRVLDTRVAIGAPATVAPGATIDVPVTGIGGIPSAGVSSIVLNVTAVNPSSFGDITVYSGTAAQPNTSNLNFAPGQTIANSVIVPVGTDGSIKLTNTSPGATDLVADVSGYYVSGTVSAAGAFASVPPARVLDTRSGIGTSAGQVQGGHKVAFSVTSLDGVPAAGSVSAVVLDVIAVNATQSGYVTAGADGQAQPGTSNLNYLRGQDVPDLVIAPVGSDGKVDLYVGSSGSVDLVADVFGYYLAGTATVSGMTQTVTPFRELDTRIGLGAAAAKVGAGQTVRLRVVGSGGIAANATTVGLTITATGASGVGYVTVWPDGSAQPFASSLNYVPGADIANNVLAATGTGGVVDIYNGSSGTVDLVADADLYVLP